MIRQTLKIYSKGCKFFSVRLNILETYVLKGKQISTFDFCFEELEIERKETKKLEAAIEKEREIKFKKLPNDLNIKLIKKSKKLLKITQCFIAMELPFGIIPSNGFFNIEKTNIISYYDNDFYEYLNKAYWKDYQVETPSNKLLQDYLSAANTDLSLVLKTDQSKVKRQPYDKNFLIGEVIYCNEHKNCSFVLLSEK